MQGGIFGEVPVKTEIRSAEQRREGTGPTVIMPPPPPSHFTLYVGLGVAAVVVGVGAWLISK